MPALELWVVYNKSTQRVDIIKTRKKAERVMITYNKLFKLLNIRELTYSCRASDYFAIHKVDKDNTFFNWNVKPAERMCLYQKFFKGEP